ncbi:E3 ubiquitin-protein ligase MARCHF7 isoform X1 [Falco biarmicus]|uniref:E3 ubiquitin-protein ligase MARCHF7 isoform X1 n=2 Tax=Falco peregrinus TaxID=8954 RepID=UPI000679067D|nr:E3 ubiquitin-protein ligase MARCHF7 isoform X1 [Falco peregrinus]XP_037252463.1 E3 ubiquitin-protein ligase MARCHF7 isoform X1 [Falco rusticolus]XP_055573458.1 E3 ubiquitin-protein ligase MARCHF7 isoform X1 [Falco cherrug]XP_056203965.1 E3 ubiquitin-protein ligase MARCHF7 isoform X1 [Falco biarmicus]
MESKPSRIPRRISVQASSSSLGSRTLTGNSLAGAYSARESSWRLESGYQESNVLNSSSRDWGIGETDTHETPWKLTTSSPTRYSGTLDHPRSGRFWGSRSRLSTSSSAHFASGCYGESERTQGAYSRLHSQQRDSDSKRPKLSCTSTSSVRSNGLTAFSDSSWRYSRIPRSSSVMLGSLGTELVRERRELERRTDLSVNNLVDHSYRSSDFSSSTYLQDRPASSYAEGARPKENSLSALRLNASMNRQLPSDHRPSFFNRDSNMSSSRSSYSSRQRRNELESPQRSMQPAFSLAAMRDETPSSSGSERVLSSQRSLNEPTADSEGRRTTRQLLSRLASSMSSTFFSRRSSQDSLHTRPLGSEESTVPRVQASTLSSSNGAATPLSEVPGLQTSEASQGFSFLRRRWGLSGVSQNHNSDSDGESYRPDSESRSTGSWLSSSLRNRCTPLFSRRRREGRDESSRISTSDTTARSQHVFRRRESGEETSLEASDSPPRASVSRPPTPAVSGIPAATASPPHSAHSRRSSGTLPGSLFRFAVPPTLGSSLSDNLMITVDIIPSGWNQSDGQESGKSKIPPSRDPERLQKIKESLLLEDSEDEEGDLCRICQMSSASSDNLLIEPCKCTGSLQYVHQECMKKWLQSKINSGSSLEAVTTCELCKEKLHLNLEDFDIHELYRAHANEQADYEFISSGLYLVVLLHLCEQRFSDMLGTASEASTRVRLPRMILKTDAGRTFILQEINRIAAEMLNWQEQRQHAFVFFLSLVKSALNITVVFEVLLNSKSAARQWDSVDLQTTQHVQGLDK